MFRIDSKERAVALFGLPVERGSNITLPKGKGWGELEHAET